MSEDIKYLELVSEMIIKLGKNPEKVVDFDAFIKEEQELIIGSYDRRNLNSFKGDWKRRFQLYLKKLNFIMKKQSGDSNLWQDLISSKLKDSRKNIPSSSTTTTTTTTATATATATLTKSTKSSGHNNVISTSDKESAIKYLNNLPTEEKWRLKTGRSVEDIMMQAINDSQYQHPCLSFILDLADPLWIKYFSSEEIREIRTHNCVQRPVVKEETQHFIDIYDNDSLQTAEHVYDFANDQKLKFADDYKKRWIKESIINAALLFGEENDLDIADYSEGDLLHNLWQFVYKAFRNSKVKAKLGERTNVSSAIGRNDGRTLELEEKRQRKSGWCKGRHPF